MPSESHILQKEHLKKLGDNFSYMDISYLRERPEKSELTVSELNSYIKHIFEADRNLSALTVRGEISNFTNHRTGHLYFSLKDEGGQVKAVMFRSSASALKFMPENGMKVIVRCSVSVYVQNGAYQLYVTSMQPDGIGALYLAYEQLKARLESEGMFSEEYKKPIPRYPSRIGVITSPTGAAVRDIIKVTGRRYPLASIYLYPSLVQGDGAEDNLIVGLDYFMNSHLVDVIIIGRGGGSIEDLWAFNSEKLARKIFECDIPVISAVGHETDFTICDFVSDLRAPTPSAAAEIAVPDVKEVHQSLSIDYDRCVSALKRIAERKEEKLNVIKEKAVLKNPMFLIETKNNVLAELKRNASDAIFKLIDKNDKKFAIAVGKANALSPLNVLSRGYSVASSKNAVIKSIKDIAIGDTLNLRISDGDISAVVTDKSEV